MRIYIFPLLLMFLLFSCTQNAKKNFFLCVIESSTNKSLGCATCHGNFHDCPWHYAYLNPALHVFNVGYLGSIFEILKCICKVYIMFHMCSLDFGFPLIFNKSLVLSHLNSLIITTYITCIYGWNNFWTISFRRWLFPSNVKFMLITKLLLGEFI